MSLTSKHFSVDEFTCRDGTAYPAEWIDSRLQLLCNMLDKIRDRVGCPIVVISGYRSHEYNTHIHGALLSQHVEGRAADVKARCATPADLHQLILEMIADGDLPDIGGLGVYPGWVHVDVRPKPPSGHIAQWTGAGLGSERTG